MFSTWLGECCFHPECKNIWVLLKRVWKWRFSFSTQKEEDNKNAKAVFSQCCWVGMHEWCRSSPYASSWTQWPLWVPSNSRCSMILCWVLLQFKLLLFVLFFLAEICPSPDSSASLVPCSQGGGPIRSGCAQRSPVRTQRCSTFHFSVKQRILFIEKTAQGS